MSQPPIVQIPTGTGKGGWTFSVPSLPPMPTGAVLNYSPMPFPSVSDNEAVFVEVVAPSKCDGVGCKGGKVLLLLSAVDCDKCKGTGTL